VIAALAGGVGGARLCAGLAAVLAPHELTVAVNTGDDFEHLGLSISPDLDSVMYTLAGRHDAGRGWGLAGESWRCMEALKALGGDDWFHLGDQDLATHLHRTQRLREGHRLSEVTRELCQALGVRHTVLPMTNGRMRTRILSDAGDLAFQDYFVRHRCEPRFLGTRFEGEAQPTAELMAALGGPSTQAIVICSSNPFLSIRPLLALPGTRQALASRRVAAIAVSPVVGGAAVKGPLAKMMRELGLPVSPVEIARQYQGLIDGLVIDVADAAQAPAIEALGIAVSVQHTLMSDLPRQQALAEGALGFARGLRRRDQ
jgi:LPPG:FO 2-phospho-L-lactate transferase